MVSVCAWEMEGSQSAHRCYQYNSSTLQWSLSICVELPSSRWKAASGDVIELMTYVAQLCVCGYLID